MQRMRCAAARVCPLAGIHSCSAGYAPVPAGYTPGLAVADCSPPPVLSGHRPRWTVAALHGRNELVAGMVAGFVCKIVEYPIDTLKVQVQTQSRSRGRTNGRASACAWRCSAVPASCAWLTRAFACIAVCVLYLAGGGAGLVCAARTPQRVCRRCRCSKRTSSKTVRCVRFAHGTRMRACGVALCACTRRCRVCTHSLHAYTLSSTHTHSLSRIHTYGGKSGAALLM